MKSIALALTACLVMTTFVVGCSRQDSVSAPGNVASKSPAVVEAAADRWLGKWNGPEGTFLQLAGGNGKYEITIQNLDGPRRFQGTAVGSGIEFERDGTKQILRARGGAETGMKWLAGKADCLTIRAGEGYCRD